MALEHKLFQHDDFVIRDEVVKRRLIIVIALDEQFLQ